MKSVARPLCLLVAVVAAACGGLGKPHTLGLPGDQVATVRGLNDGYTPLLGTEKHISFNTVDGKELPEGWVHVIELLPGRHTLNCSYLMIIDGHPAVSGTKPFDVDVEAGRVYQADFVVRPKVGWDVAFEPVSAEALAKEKGKDGSGNEKAPAAKSSE